MEPEINLGLRGISSDNCFVLAVEEHFVKLDTSVLL